MHRAESSAHSRKAEEQRAAREAAEEKKAEAQRERDRLRRQEQERRRREAVRFKIPILPTLFFGGGVVVVGW